MGTLLEEAMRNIMVANTAVGKIERGAYADVDLGYGPPITRAQQLSYAVEWRGMTSEQLTYFTAHDVQQKLFPKRPPYIKGL